MSKPSTTMRAALLENADEGFRVVDLPVPAAASGQVLVRVHASGVNPLDLKIRAGAAPHARHPLPAVLGIDLAGTVVAVGADVTGLTVGEEVYGMTGGVGGYPGSLAEYSAVDARLLARKPRSLDMRQAATLPLVFITAWEGLVDRAGVMRGQRVLVHGGAGGVGHIAIQIAKASGADVFATGSAKHQSYIASLGATPIEHERHTVDEYVAMHTQGEGFDVVYDTVGGPVLDASFRAVKRFGQVVSALGWGTHALAPLSFKAASYSGVFTLLPLLTGIGREHHGEIMKEATSLVERGLLVPRVDPQVYTLETVSAAHVALASGASQGKVVVSIIS